MVCDGEFIYVLSDTDGQKTAVKVKADPSHGGYAKAMFATWRREHIVRLLPDEKVDGKECWVIEARLRNKGSNNPFPVQRCWFRKDLGLVVQGYAKLLVPEEVAVPVRLHSRCIRFADIMQQHGQPCQRAGAGLPAPAFAFAIIAFIAYGFDASIWTSWSDTSWTGRLP
jgi:hypothetical protein